MPVKKVDALRLISLADKRSFKLDSEKSSLATFLFTDKYLDSKCPESWL